VAYAHFGDRVERAKTAEDGAGMWTPAGDADFESRMIIVDHRLAWSVVGLSFQT
jgi:hypothetical protein